MNSNRCCTGSEGPSRSLLVVAVFALFLPAVAGAGPTPAQKCESGKNLAAGKYAACIQKAQQKFVAGGSSDAAGRDAALLSCETKQAGKWTKLETKSDGMCPTTGDSTSITDFLDACLGAAQDALGGAPLPLDVATCNDDLAACSDDLSAANADLSSCEADLADAQAKRRIIIFDSGVSTAGNLGDRAATTAACSAAKPAYLYCPGGVLAMVSYSGGDDIASMPLNYADFPSNAPIIAGPGLVQMATNWADLLDGSWAGCLSDSCFSGTPAGLYSGAVGLWTGTNSNGTVSSNCSDWTNSTSFGGNWVQTNVGGTSTFSSGGLICTITLRRACFCY